MEHQTSSTNTLYLFCTFVPPADKDNYPGLLIGVWKVIGPKFLKGSFAYS